MNEIQALVVIVEGAQQGAIIKIVNPDGSEATTCHGNIVMRISPQDAAEDETFFFERFGRPAFTVIQNLLRTKFGL